MERYAGPYLFVPIHEKRIDDVRHGCSPRLEHVLHAIQTLTAKHGTPPTRRELADALGVSVSLIRLHIQRGQRLGLIRSEPLLSRALRVVG